MEVGPEAYLRGMTRSTFASLYWHMAMLVGVGFITIGVAGGIGWAASLLFGKDFISGNEPGTLISDERCGDYLRFHPEAADCGSAAVAHHFDEFVQYHTLAAVVGAVILVSHWLLRRRLSAGEAEGARSRRIHALLGLGAFGLAAVVLLPLGAVQTAHEPDSGAGWFLVCGIAAACAFIAYAAGTVRSKALTAI